MDLILLFSLIVMSMEALATNTIDMQINTIDTEWEKFKITYGKSYSTDFEDSLRKKIFLQNNHKIRVHNKKFKLGLVNFELGINQFSDMLSSEFLTIMNGTHKISNYSDGASTFTPPEGIQLTESIDWREKGAVTPVKNQGLHCNACWAFSATGALEALNFKKTQTLVSLSEQNLIDCSKKFGNSGCVGGFMDNAYTYVKMNHGIDTEESYPYEAQDDECRYTPSDSETVNKGYSRIPTRSEERLQQAVGSIGPVSASIDVTNLLKSYKGGVFYDPDCSSDDTNHGVLVVGYGTDKESGDYWIVKNSWGDSWGEEGYVRLARNKDNHCGIATTASFPV